MELSLNSWSFERQLGPLRLIEWDTEAKRNYVEIEHRPEATTLLGLIVRMGMESYQALELAYVHLRDISEDALRDLKNVAEISGVQPASLLLDFGDLSTPDPLRTHADLQLYKQWIDIAAKAGFQRVRIPAGESAAHDEAALKQAAAGLCELAEYGADAGVRVVTENLGELLSTSENCLKLLGMCHGKIGLTVDFGNFKRNKYEQLAEIMPYAETVHAKASADKHGIIAEEDFRRCIELCRQSGFKGPLSLTYLGSGNTWEKLDEMQKLSESEPALMER
ncbi:sugar phosphate isomerase/epimerase family protein [Cohnella kolymensis]|uniref:sugar phosphate isomerase/epimerase family protein n=1 Tax=Cohnella kolymensis TaxID=1590652 RepID=UPI000696DA86|nr:TIM barrel protein [Cohnella kolymensis]